MYWRYLLFGYVLCITISMVGFRPERVILATDTNPTYIQFWPLVAQAWRHWIGLKPTLALIADDDVKVDESLGDVIRFKPIPGIPTSFYAQVVRLLLPAVLYPDEVCLLSDIDMLPLSKIFFLQSAAKARDDDYVVYTDKAYDGSSMQYPICYNAARGSVFRELVGIKSIEEIPAKVREWFGFKIGWTSDELILFGLLLSWSGNPDRLVRLGYKMGSQRIDRSCWDFDELLLSSGYYVDSHMLRPYDKHRVQIDALVESVFKHQKS